MTCNPTGRALSKLSERQRDNDVLIDVLSAAVTDLTELVARLAVSVAEIRSSMEGDGR